MTLARGCLIVCAALSAALAPRAAEACRSVTPDGCVPYERVGQTLPYFTAGLILAVPSLLTNGMILGWYARTQTVPLAWPVAGLVLWSAHAAISTTMLVYSVQARYTGIIEFSALYSAVSYASIIASTVALFAPRPASETRVVAMPWWTPHGAGVSFATAL